MPCLENNNKESIVKNILENFFLRNFFQGLDNSMETKHMRKVYLEV